ncbi:MAG: amino acid permease [Dehalococcoidales bacterium]|nr:amino acid permease [Dehalococcoidales bacterium]
MSDGKVEGPETGLARRLGLISATLVGTGVILGAGIYVLVGVASKQAGNAAWLSFLISAVVAGFTGLSYARLCRLRPKNAPEFQFLNLAFGRMPGFLAGWLVLWATIISSAAVALGFAGYLEYIFQIPYLPGAIGLVVICSIIVFVGVGESAILAGILTLVEAAGLIIIIAIGIPSLGNVDILEMPLGITGVFGAASLVFFAYLGFEGMANLSEEMRNPERDLPKAMMLSLGISTVFYMLVAISAVSVLGWNDLSQSGAPLAEVASVALGEKADILLTYIALASTANTVLLLLFAASRAMWGMGCAGVLPMKLCTIGKHRRTPWITIIIVGIFAAIFTLIRNIQDVAEFTNFATLLAFIGVNASAVKIFANEHAESKFKHITRDIVLPLVGCIASAWLAIGLGWRAAVFGVSLLVVSVIVHYLLKRFSSGTG